MTKPMKHPLPNNIKEIEAYYEEIKKIMSKLEEANTLAVDYYIDKIKLQDLTLALTKVAIDIYNDILQSKKTGEKNND